MDLGLPPGDWMPAVKAAWMLLAVSLSLSDPIMAVQHTVHAVDSHNQDGQMVAAGIALSLAEQTATDSDRLTTYNPFRDCGHIPHSRFESSACAT